MKKAISNIAVFLLIGVIAAYFVLFAMGMRPYITRSGSMEPAIKTGSVCFVDTGVTFEEIEKGDIVAFVAAGGEAVTHRAVSVTKEAIETKGDANDVSDGFTTTKENLIGVTVFSVPYLGYAVGYLQQPAGKLMLGVVILAIIAFGVIDYIDDKKKKKEEDVKE